MKKQRVSGMYVLGSLLLIGFIIFYVGPLLYSCILSFGTSNSGVSAYLQLFESDSFWLAFKNLLFYMIIMVPLLFCISFGIALAINRKLQNNSKLQRSLLTLHMFPFIIPSSIVAYIVGCFFDTEIICLLFIYLWKNYGYCMLILLGGIRSIEKETLESARMDGASEGRIVVSIVFPQIKSFAAFSIMIAIMAIFKLYRESKLLLGDYPGEAAYYMQNYINNCFYSLAYERIAACTMALCVFFCIIIYLLYHRQIKEGEL